MGESRAHLELVKITREYIENIVPDNQRSKIEVDSPDTSRPTNIGTYIPDVFFRNDDLLIIGEAKTYDDYGRSHSRAQYIEGCEYCKNFPGRSMFILSVPWQIVPEAKNDFKRMKKEYGIDTEIIVLNELGLEASF